MGNWLTDKYSEGFCNHRFYAGCQNVDAIENRAEELAKQLFKAESAYVQPHSGCDANLIAYLAILHEIKEVPKAKELGKPLAQLSKEEFEKIRQSLVNSRILGMDLSAGGHLTHGFRMNISGKLFQSYSYNVDPHTEQLDYDEIEKQAIEVCPDILVAGYSAYPRLINFKRMRKIADRVGAILLVDMAHFAGLVAANVLVGDFNPVEFAHVVTSTTHKTLRGPRGGIILAKKEFEAAIKKGCPLVQGGPLPHVMAAKAIAFEEALTPSFQDYGQQIVKNAKRLAECLKDLGVRLVTDGTDNHLILLDVMKSFQLTGSDAEQLLAKCGITVNKNAIPYDPNGVWKTSGVRIGLAAMTTRHMKEPEMEKIAECMVNCLKGNKIEPIQREVRGLTEDFPLYSELTNQRKHG